MAQSTNSEIPCQVNENKIHRFPNYRIEVQTNVKGVKGYRIHPRKFYNYFRDFFLEMNLINDLVSHYYI